MDRNIAESLGRPGAEVTDPDIYSPRLSPFHPSFPIACHTLKQDGAIVNVNDAWKNLTGYQSAEIQGRVCADLLAGKSTQEFGPWFDDLKRGAQVTALEIEISKKNGETLAIRLTGCGISSESGAFQIAFCFLQPILENVLTETASHHREALEQQKRIIERTAAEEQALGALLRLSHYPLGIEDFLQQALECLLDSVPWLELQQRGGIFLVDDGSPNSTLRLIASCGLAAEIRTACARLPFGKCHCGKAATSREIQFASCLDGRHEISYAGIKPHGHYAVPIMTGRSLLGVLNLYLPHGHEQKPHELSFLRRVADVLGMGIMRRQADARISHLAYHDTLTGLPNRSLLRERLEQALAQSRRHRHLGAAIFLDLDHFKTINDALGHPVGDALLKEIATRLAASIRQEDTAARLGGDEFVILLPEISNDIKSAADRAQQMVEKIIEILSSAYQIEGHELNVTASAGISLFPSGDADVDSILTQADTAMYRAKIAGRNTFRFYQPSMQAAADERLAIQKHLRHAIHSDQLQLHYQVQVDQQGTIKGVEALLRWQHPERGMVSPGAFIPVAEETGLILPIGAWVMSTACSQIKHWSNETAETPLEHISVNVSPQQFRQADFVSQVEEILSLTELNPRRLMIEITEGVVIDNIADTIEKMRALKSLGVGFSLDDFGTGYSSLTYLKRLPLDQLKINQSFTRDIATDPNDAAIVETIISLAKHLNLNVIAEGVETSGDLDILYDKGCRIFQGYYFSPPLPLEKLEPLLARGTLSLTDRNCVS